MCLFSLGAADTTHRMSSVGGDVQRLLIDSVE